MGADFELNFVPGYPATINDDSVTDIVRKCAEAVVGKDHVVEPSKTMGGEDFAYVTGANGGDQAVLLRRDEQRGVILALPVKRGRPRRGSPLMTTPLAGRP